jgi:hypothetical protein
MKRPAKDDEVGLREWWAASLDQHHDKQDVIRNAAQALALRDAEIARLQAQLREHQPPRRG